MKKLFFVIACLALPVFAEETTPPPPPLLENNADLSVLLTSGNTEITTVGLGLESTYRPEGWVAKGKVNYLTSKDTGSTKAESFSAELRGDRKLSDPLALFISGTYLKNRFTGFEDRMGALLGLSYAVYKDAEHTLTAETGPGVLYENRTDTTSQTFVNAQAGLTYAWKFSPTSELGAQISFLDNLKTTADWRLSSGVSLTTILNSIFSLKTGFKLDYLNIPVTGKKNTDTTTTVALVAKF